MNHWGQLHENSTQIQTSATDEIMHCQKPPGSLGLGDLSPEKPFKWTIFSLYNEEKWREPLYSTVPSEGGKWWRGLLRRED